MASGNLDSANLKGVAYNGLINEDVMQQIWDISRIPLPLSDMIGTDSAKNSYKEWTQDELAPPDITNAKVDGADATGNDTRTGARVGNHCQNSDKIVKVSTRARDSDTIGRSDELAYQVMQRQRELRRDVEAIMLTQQASVADDGNTVPGKSAGLGAWLTTNTNRGATGADGGFASGVVSAPTAGTTRGLTETLVRDNVESIYQQGGDPTVFMAIPKMKRAFGEYLFTSSARVATLMSDTGQAAEAAVAKGSIDIFVSDFGTLELVPNRLMPITNSTGGSEATEVYIIDPMYLRIAYLTGYRVTELAKNGTADNRQMIVDWTLMVLTEKAQGIIADINYTTPVAA